MFFGKFPKKKPWVKIEGGHYSAWLNDTGLVEAFAFDGTHQALVDGFSWGVWSVLQDGPRKTSYK